MPFYMQYEGIDGSVRNADAFDFSQLTTEPTEAGAVAGIVIAATSDNNRVAIDDGADVLTGGTFDFVPQLTTETGLTTTATLTGVISSFGKEGMRPPPVVPSARMVACLGIS